MTWSRAYWLRRLCRITATRLEKQIPTFEEKRREFSGVRGRYMVMGPLDPLIIFEKVIFALVTMSCLSD